MWVCRFLSFHSMIFFMSTDLNSVSVIFVASTMRDRPWSAIFSPEEHSVILPSRRPTSIMPFHSSNLSKSMSINNIAMLVPKHTHQQVFSGLNWKYSYWVCSEWNATILPTAYYTVSVLLLITKTIDKKNILLIEIKLK